MDEDLFGDILNLEDNYYQDGHRLGVEDGSRAGRIEGRTFGLEKGFDKFFEMGKLHGKSQIWTARLHSSEAPSGENEKSAQVGSITNIEGASTVKKLPDNARLEKHIRTLFALTELESLSTSNDEDDVSEFDDRFKRAVSKAKVIENIIGEQNGDAESSQGQKSTERKGVKLSRAATAEKNIEDFGLGRAASSS